MFNGCPKNILIKLFGYLKNILIVFCLPTSCEHKIIYAICNRISGFPWTFIYSERTFYGRLNENSTQLDYINEQMYVLPDYRLGWMFFYMFRATFFSFALLSRFSVDSNSATKIFLVEVVFRLLLIFFN